MSAWDAIQQVASYVGTAGTGLATHVYALLRKARSDAADAKKIAAAASAQTVALAAALGELQSATDTAIQQAVEATALGIATAAFEPYRTMPRTLRLEMNAFKDEVDTALTKAARASRPDLLGIEEMQRQCDELVRRVAAIERRIEDERSARHALGRDVQQRHAETMRAWGEMKGLLGEISGRIDALMDERSRDRNDRGRRS